MNPAITHLLIEKWVCHLIIPTLCFQLLRTHWVTVQAKNSVKNAPASTALTQVSYQSHNTRTTNRNLHGRGKGIQHKGEQK